MHKSYLKWAGGKSRILSSVLTMFPQHIKTFYEPFLGSGIVALNICADAKLLSDLNSDLINCHKYVRDDPSGIINELTQLYAQGRADYYALRDEFNSASDGLRKAALFIYLNKHGFNGMCRYNTKGDFNIPVGKSKTIHFPDEEILATSHILSSALFGSLPFEDSMGLAGEGDAVYCDPPYIPVSATLSDINYTGQGFDMAQQKKLHTEALNASRRGASVVISNHDTSVTRDLYKDATRICEVTAWRSISSKTSTRGKVGELLALYE